MKIITRDAAYIQKEDIISIEKCYEKYFSKQDIPKFLRSFRLGIFRLDDDNKYDFVEFKDQEAIEFIKDIYWIVDYADVKNMPIQEIVDTGKKLWEERCKISSCFNAMSKDKREKNIDMVVECDLLDYEVYSLRNIQHFKEGTLKMQLPKGVEYPEELSKSKCIKKFFGSILNRKYKK